MNLFFNHEFHLIGEKEFNLKAVWSLKKNKHFHNYHNEKWKL